MKTSEKEVTKRLHTRGGRMTTQRRLILDALDCLGGHPNAEQIFDLARNRDPGLNLSTVYRTLRWLEQEGLVSARHFDETGRHDHFDPALPAETVQGVQDQAALGGHATAAGMQALSYFFFESFHFICYCK